MNWIELGFQQDLHSFARAESPEYSLQVLTSLRPEDTDTFQHLYLGVGALGLSLIFHPNLRHGGNGCILNVIQMTTDCTVSGMASCPLTSDGHLHCTWRLGMALCVLHGLA